MDRSLQELRAQFFAALDRPGDKAERWMEIWQLLVKHPWYQAELHKGALCVLWRAHAPLEWAEDLEHQAMLVLAQDCAALPTCMWTVRDLRTGFPVGWLRSSRMTVHKRCEFSILRMVLRLPCNLAEIASKLGVSYWKARRLLRLGLKRLAKML